MMLGALPLVMRRRYRPTRGFHGMRQPDLLPANEWLLDDATGSIAYFPNFLDPQHAHELFDSLHAIAPWSATRREMYGRVVDVPRLTAAWRLDDGSAPPPLATLASAVATAVPAPYNSVGMNLYRDGNDSVAMHNDHLYEIAEHQPIAIVSLGATRRMVIRAKQSPHRQLKLDLEAGSLLLMSYATQLHYDHGIPKQRGSVGPRISCAFRVRPQPSRDWSQRRE